MPGSTGTYGLPYLEPDDAPHIPGATQALAEAVETELARLDDKPQPTQVDNLTSIGGIVSSTPAAGSPVVGTAFVAPPTGKVYVTVSASVSSSVNGFSCFCGYEVRAGSTVGSGTPLLAASFNRSVQAGDAVNSGAPSRLTASNRFLLTGLTAGNSYNVRTMHWVNSGGTGTVTYRALLVEPVL